MGKDEFIGFDKSDQLSMTLEDGAKTIAVRVGKIKLDMLVTIAGSS